MARRLRRFRHQSGLTQEELAARAGLNRNYVGMIEREENSPTGRHLGKARRSSQDRAAVVLRHDELISDAVGLHGSINPPAKGIHLREKGAEDHDADHK